MPKNYLKYLESNCKNFKKENKEIFDIVIYGSSMKGKTNSSDVDLMLVFKDRPLSKRLELSQNLKSILKNEINNIDIKTMNLQDFFDEAFFARQGILIEGLSLITNKKLTELIGFKGFSIFTYNLKKLDHNKKTLFTYALSGRSSEGVLKSLSGIRLGRGAVKIPIGDSIEFESFLKSWNTDYKRKDILESEL